MNVKLMERFAPKININIQAMNKMKEYIRQSDLEIGWLGTARRVDNVFYIDDVFLFKQEVHSTTTEITTEGLNEFAMELLYEKNGVEIWNNMKVWGHSHVNMPTSPSGQDDNQMEVFAENADDFFIRIIANKQGDFRIDLYDFTTGVIYEKLPYDISYGADTDIIESLYKKIAEIEEMICSRIDPSEELINSIKSEIDDKVTKKIYNVNKNNINTSQSWWDDYVDCSGYNNYSKKNTKESEEKGEKILKIFDNLEEEQIFECMYAIEYGVGLVHQLGINLTQDEEIDLELLIEDYCECNKEDYYRYLGYIQ